MNDNVNLSAIESIANDFVQQYKRALKLADKNATGTLINSIDYDVTLNGTKLTISITASENWKYVEYGRKPGTFPNLDAILSWIKVKGLPRGNSAITIKGHGAYDVEYVTKRGTRVKRHIKSLADRKVLPTENQLAYLIGRSIKTKGIPAGNYVDNTLKSTGMYEKLDKAIAKLISDRFMSEIKDEINETIVNLK